MDAYESWALFLIFVSILILITGVVLLTHKKPDNHPGPHSAAPAVGTPLSPMARKRRARRGGVKPGDEEEGLTGDEPDGDVLWQVGDVSDDEDGEEYPSYLSRRQGLGEENGEGERQRILSSLDNADDDEDQRASTSSDATLARPEAEADADFGKWESTGKTST